MRHFLFQITGEGTRQAWDTAETAALVYLGLGLVVVVLALGRLIDWRRKRSSEAAALEARVSDAFMNEPELVRAPVAAVSHVPVWPAAPTTLELRGHVNAPQSKEKAVRTALRVVAEYPGRVRLEDHLSVDPAPLRHAA